MHASRTLLLGVSVGLFASILIAAGGGHGDSTAPSGLGAQAVASCVRSIDDAAGPGCLRASSSPVLGDLYPLSQSWYVSPSGDVGIGTTQPASRLDVAGTTTTEVLTITGGADVAEPFVVEDERAVPGMVVVVDPSGSGALRIAEQEYDRGVVGVISGAGGVRAGLTLSQRGRLEGTHPVALAGRVHVLVDASAGAVVPGDLLTTSATPGHARRVDDHSRANGAILGKALTPLPEGRGLVLAVVGLQ